MIYIREAPSEKGNRKVNELPIIASGKTHKDTLGNLIAAINAEEVDTENKFLIITED
jgi:hypothetical protein